MKRVLFSVALASFFGVIAQATVNSQTGCGLGSQIIKDDSSAIMLALQATTNGTSGNQTFGITSGTSGCDKRNLVFNEKVQEFVASNMDRLAKEIAIGEGESVETLAELLNVSNKEVFITSLQSNYNKVFTSAKAQMGDVLTNIQSL